MKRFIAIAGNIGVGKSELTKRLGQFLNWKVFLEPVAQNPYLTDFYSDRPRWAFHSQMFFLSQRLADHHTLTQEAASVIQDRSLYENAEVFAKNLWLEKSMTNRDYQTYRDFYDLLVKLLPPPDLIIYLQAAPEILQQRIKQRGRKFEQEIPLTYLTQLNQLYDDWAKNFKPCPVLTINTNTLNLINNDQAFQQVTEKILKKLGDNPLPF
ncbi:MAG: deoxynucleoside kinase [Candidatus Buchananbacteria bacterium]